MQDDIIERLSFMRFEPKAAMLVGHDTSTVGEYIGRSGSRQAILEQIDEEQPLAGGPFDLVVSLARLDTVNDLPGALIHCRNALTPDGLIIAQVIGAESLPALRKIMLAADGDRPAARIHPQIDDRAATALLQRAGFSQQVVDTYKLTLRYCSLRRLVADLRGQALGNVLADPAPTLNKAALACAEAAFEALKEADGRVSETFQVLSLTAWR